VRARVTNLGTTPFTVDALQPTLPVPPEAVELLDFTGRHLRERSPQRTASTHGLRVRENRTGRTPARPARVGGLRATPSAFPPVRSGADAAVAGPGRAARLKGLLSR
jgi:alpha-galactosidase